MKGGNVGFDPMKHWPGRGDKGDKSKTPKWCPVRGETGLCLLRDGHDGKCVFPVTRGHTEGGAWVNGTFDPHAATSTGGGLIGPPGFDKNVQSKVYAPVYDAKTCVHDGSKVSLTLKGDKRIYGARGAGLVTVAHLDLVIDLAGMVRIPGSFVKTAPRRFARLKGAQGPEYMRLDWPDMTAPKSIPIRFWTTLLELLPGHTCIACVGSHGRTGTAMAALLVADGVTPDLAIGMVREQHCKRAIETPEQEAYIRRLGQ